MYQKRYQFIGKWINNWFEMTKEQVIQNFKDRNVNPDEMIKRLESDEIITAFDVQWRYKK
jgi:hypothetical protein